MSSVFKRGRYWYACWNDADGQPHTKSTKQTDKGVAERIARKKEEDAALRREGNIDVREDRYGGEGKRPLTQHVADFKSSLASRNNVPQYVSETIRQIEKVIGLVNAKYIADLTASAVEKAIASMKSDDRGGSLRNLNAYLRSIKSFAQWLKDDKRTRDNDLSILRAYNTDTDRRHIRRCLTDDELSRLIATAERRYYPQETICGRDRAMVYRLAAGSGFRADELRSLTKASFDLQADPPTVTVAAAYSKRRREDVQPIRRDLAELLAAWLASKAEGRVFTGLPTQLARMLRGDLAAARDAWINEAGDNQRERQAREKSDFLRFKNAAGEKVDFHATRHTFISNIVNGGASVKVAQDLARHSTPTLTIGRYAHTRLHDLTGALDKLPAADRRPDQPQLQELRATGTDGPQTSRLKSAENAQRTRGESRQKRASGKTEKTSSNNCTDSDDERRNVLKLATLRASEQAQLPTSEPHSALDSKSDAGQPVAGSSPVPSALSGKELRQGKKVLKSQQNSERRECAENDPRKAELDAVWYDLPEAIKAAIAVMVRSSL